MASKPPSGDGPSTFRIRPSTSTARESSERIFNPTRASSQVDHIVLQYVDAKISAVKAEMSGEIKNLETSLKEIEAQRTIDYSNLASSIQNVAGTLPTKETIRNYVLGGFGAVIAALALGWAVFDTGAGVVGSMADSILDAKQSARDAKTRNEELDNKLDLLLERSEGSNNITQAARVN